MSKRYTPEYYEWRKSVLERDDYTCQKCGATSYEKKIHAHHVIPWDEQDGQYNYDVDNGLTLCSLCHNQLHLINREFSEETRQKISEARSGIESWNKGGTLSDEHKKKISISINNKLSEDPEYRKKLRDSQIGRKHTEESLKKMSESQKKRWEKIKENEGD